jgi:hypothetical protein
MKKLLLSAAVVWALALGGACATTADAAATDATVQSVERQREACFKMCQVAAEQEGNPAALSPCERACLDDHR